MEINDLKEQIQKECQRQARFVLMNPSTEQMYPKEEVIQIVGDLLKILSESQNKVFELEQQLENADLYMAKMAQEAEREYARLQGQLDHIAYLRRELNDDDEHWND